MYIDSKLLSQFKNPPRGYGLVPFWFWNDDLREEHILFQINEMNDKGIEEFIIHARKGLEVSYLSETWFEKIGIALKEASRLGMHVWIYDEENWPSGYAGGRVTKENPDFCGKYLKMLGEEDYVPENHTLVAKVEGRRFYQGYTSWNPAYSECFYVDMLNKSATESFIKHTHEQYYIRFKEYFSNTIKGFFVDEPGFYNNFTMYSTRDDENTITWTDEFPAYFKAQKGYDIIPCLEHIWRRIDDLTIKYRVDYYEVLGEMYRENFIGTIRKYCDDHGVKLIGHLHSEEFLPYHVKTQGDLLKGISGLHYSGIDRIDYNTSKVTEKYGSSAEHIYGLQRTLSETFAESQWGLTLKDIKRWTNWQYVRGVNMMVPHAFYSSIEGDRMKECPPSLFFQNCYWKYFKKYSDFVKRMSFILTRGSHVCPVGVYYPITTQYELMQPDNISECQSIDRLFIDVSNSLLDYQLDFDYLNDDAIAKAEVKEGVLTLGNETYKAIILVEPANLPYDTLNKLKNFAQAGGMIIVIGSFDIAVIGDKESEICACEIFTLLNSNNVEHLHRYVMNERYTYQFDGSKLADILHGKLLEDIRLPIRDKDIKYLHRKLQNGHIYYFINESGYEKHFSILLKHIGKVYKMDPYNGRVEEFGEVSAEKDHIGLKLSLVAFGEEVLLISDEPLETGESIGTPAKQPPSGREELAHQYIVDGEWDVGINGEIKKLPLQHWEKWGISGFSGKLEYVKEFTIDRNEGKKYIVALGVIYDCSEVYLNGKKVDELVWDPYQADITDFINNGKNELKLIVSNTLGNELEGRYYPSGLLGPVKIVCF